MTQQQIAEVIQRHIDVSNDKGFGNNIDADELAADIEAELTGIPRYEVKNFRHHACLLRGEPVNIAYALVDGIEVSVVTARNGRSTYSSDAEVKRAMCQELAQYLTMNKDA